MEAQLFRWSPVDLPSCKMGSDVPAEGKMAHNNGQIHLVVCTYMKGYSILETGRKIVPDYVLIMVLESSGKYTITNVQDKLIHRYLKLC